MNFLYLIAKGNKAYVKPKYRKSYYSSDMQYTIVDCTVLFPGCHYDFQTLTLKTLPQIPHTADYDSDMVQQSIKIFKTSKSSHAASTTRGSIIVPYLGFCVSHSF